MCELRGVDTSLFDELESPETTAARDLKAIVLEQVGPGQVRDALCPVATEIQVIELDSRLTL